MEIVAKNGRKVKALALALACFLPLSKMKKVAAKMDEKFRLYSLTFLLFFASFSKMKSG